MNASDLLAKYRALRQVTLQMAGAARESAWDSVTALEAARNALIGVIKREDTIAWSGPQAGEKASVIRAILDLDAEIAATAKLRMAELSDELSNIRSKKKLQKAYQIR